MRQSGCRTVVGKLDLSRGREMPREIVVVTDSSNTEVAEGYRGNIVGFGWTNGTFLALYHALPPAQQKQVLAEKATPKPN